MLLCSYLYDFILKYILPSLYKKINDNFKIQLTITDQKYNFYNAKGGDGIQIKLVDKKTNKPYLLKIGDVPIEELDIIKNRKLFKNKIVPKPLITFKTNITGLILNNNSPGKNNKFTVNGYIQEFIGETLSSFISKNKNYKLSTNDFKKLLYKVLKFQKITKMLHGDLHIKNILVIKNKKGLDFRLIDFGRSFAYKKSHYKKIPQYPKIKLTFYNKKKLRKFLSNLHNSSDFNKNFPTRFINTNEANGKPHPFGNYSKSKTSPWVTSNYKQLNSLL